MTNNTELDVADFKKAPADNALSHRIASTTLGALENVLLNAMLDFTKTGKGANNVRVQHIALIPTQTPGSRAPMAADGGVTITIINHKMTNVCGARVPLQEGV